MKIKTSELTGLTLAWAVSTIENPEWEDEGHTANVRYPDDDGWIYRPDTDWSQGGPIIEREEIHLLPTGDAAKWKAYLWSDDKGNFVHHQYALTPLVAAMRCFCAAKLGDEVDVPEELLP